ncbi:NAD-dependent epimerase/dehydratase family protein, partial [bacterium]|nr:NAD-dependent epimerase/dehydratase family protein [bacterium]
MKTVVITGISGVLGSALGKYYLQQGWKVVGVSRQNNLEGDYFSELCTNQQKSEADARSLLKYDPDLIIVNAGQIETEVGAEGVPLVDQFEAITTVNYRFPAMVGLAAA